MLRGFVVAGLFFALLVIAKENTAQRYELRRLCADLQVNLAIAAPWPCYQQTMQSGQISPLSQSGSGVNKTLRGAAVLVSQGKLAEAEKLWRRAIMMTHHRSFESILRLDSRGDNLQLGIDALAKGEFASAFRKFEAVTASSYVAARYTTGFDDDRSLSNVVQSALVEATHGDYKRCVKTLVTLKDDVRFDYRLLFLGLCRLAQGEGHSAREAWVLGSTSDSSSQEDPNGVEMFSVQMLLLTRPRASR